MIFGFFQKALWLAAGLVAGLAQAAGADSAPADGLHAKYGELRGQLANNQYRQPLYLDSSEATDGVAGNVYALIDHPFETAAGALIVPGSWCEILILHFNTKYCRASAGRSGSILNVSIGESHDQPLAQAHPVEFAFRVVARHASYLQVKLNADHGPFSTRDYRFVFEAVPLEDGRTFIHLSYAYGFGTMGRLAMQAYLGTIGRNKVGFTVAGTQADGQPLHIGGTRGVVERNTMRYYLAIESYMGALSAPPQAQLEKRLRDWFAAAERYPRQLHEMEQGEYLDMKRREHLRQQAGLSGGLLQLGLLFQPLAFQLDEFLADVRLVHENVLQRGLGLIPVYPGVGELRLDGGLARV